MRDYGSRESGFLLKNDYQRIWKIFHFCGILGDGIIAGLWGRESGFLLENLFQRICKIFPFLRDFRGRETGFELDNYVILFNFYNSRSTE